jgi:hypothetical protein
VGVSPEVLPSRNFSGLANFRIIPRIETYPAVVRLAQTVPGKIILLALFAVGLRFATPDWIPVAAALAVITFFPSWRRILVTIATLVFTFVLPWSKYLHPVYTSALLVFVIAIGAVLFWLSIELPKSIIGRHPIVVLLTGFSLLLIFASSVPNNTRWYLTVWDFTATFGVYLWFIAYSLLDRRSPGRDDFALQLGTYRPFWGPTVVPVPKGATYWRRIEAKDAEQLAVVQLKGLKLLAWSLLITVFSNYFVQFVHGYLAIPTMGTEFLRSVHRVPDPWYVCWATLFCEFFQEILSVAIWGHRLVACARMAGFNALRNTYRPLSSRTIAEFWNRYYFYFKELLVDVFFYPVFLNYFKSHKKLRLAVATFVAAGFGNAFYHFVFGVQYIAQLGLWRAFLGYHVYMFYCTVLATAIAISQVRTRRAPPSGFIRGQVAPAFCVILFYCLIHVFDYPDRQYPITEHFRFVAHLFNLNV